MNDNNRQNEIIKRGKPYTLKELHQTINRPKKSELLDTISQYERKAAYDALGEATHYMVLKERALRAIKSEKVRKDKKLYSQKRDAISACNRLINKALRKAKSVRRNGVKSAPNKAIMSDIKRKDSGLVANVR